MPTEIWLRAESDAGGGEEAEEGGRHAALVKSRDPHLAGGEIFHVDSPNGGFSLGTISITVSDGCVAFGLLAVTSKGNCKLCRIRSTPATH